VEDIGHQDREAAPGKPLGHADIGRPDAPNVCQEHNPWKIGHIVGTKE
jgi:hypothetical protein